ncbi:MAG: cobalamin biosynthesis protein CobD [Sulfurimonas sp. RIFOXYD12_FULL_33_39]|uniref:adenosylcobinamide-phosphate synthase CbiB n=1 Tax=unclassified Sulfurimonas TaxID=2623549 RepID=UPI0008C793C2|nr:MULTISPECIES: adenosylcobinamide-phosphate synthase CbiB [unclassified Sulfurimonas]OHE02416.1 MAG: cobalamin biosynthesis protein CobD [Sulfurimonas sp. RIFCSPLOWO2_12_FULL_34_6]OHE10792.1 MAG: cobalamin biosynthesis protein CobD [Sulfurimonas sp. RIFOXYD12_FULL_33_39]OHE13438.1 MAG: cobalamin biosynthesis protein CobD [Sulfurimonas sp. RIFOXYD2_FULL_34_21]
MSNLSVALLAYIIDKLFGEFRFIKHPIICIGELITIFESRFYKDSIMRGLLLVMFVLLTVTASSLLISSFFGLFNTALNIILTSFVASMFLAHKMLFDSVKNTLTCKNKKEAIAMLVSRDTEHMNQSDIYKASIETYAENLSDGVIAPLFYLVLFGLPGIIIYKAINTMDSMVGYRNEKYENYGKVAAYLDDIVNFIPSRITALLIMLLGGVKNSFSFYKDGKKHDSPNAGHPITAMALFLHVKLGGPTSYFGKIKEKPYFGVGAVDIKADDLQKALSLKPKIDFTIIITLALLYFFIG